MVATGLRLPLGAIPVAPAVLQTLETTVQDFVEPGQASNPPFRHIMIVDRSDARSALDVLRRTVVSSGGATMPRLLA